MHQWRTEFCHPFFKYWRGEIHQRMKVQYSDACLSLHQVYEWTRKFLNSTSSVTDSPRPGQAHNHLRERLCWFSWDKRGVILEHYVPRGNTVNIATYADLKNHLHPAIKSKRLGLLSTVVLLQHDNAQSHTAHSTVAPIQDLSFECLSHLPYSSDLASSDFHVLDCSKREWKASLSGPTKRCRKAVHEWLRSQPKDFFARGIHALPKRWNTCMVHSGDYIEKLSHCVPSVFNNKLWDKKYLRFSFDSLMYTTALFPLCLINING
jgi:hypothetical protein